ncbi:MAG TPA: oligoendopeptidase F, partial [Pirellulaceae bacterium]|nr:oligoendopeptidase F [Pirellulaceae bacterium]
MNQTVKLPPRNQVAEHDTWDLCPLFSSDEAWEAAFQQLELLFPRLAEFQGSLSQSAARLAECLALEIELDRLGETLGNYAFLKSSEDQTNQTYQRMVGRFHNLAARAAETASFILPEVMAIDDETMDRFLHDQVLADFRLRLERMLRYKPHTLSQGEERLLAMQSEMAQATSHIFSQLHDADLKFGLVTDERGRQIELSPSTFTQLLQSPDRA